MAKGNGKRGKTAGSSAALPELIPQPHGGALFSGGVHGNNGGSGRPPDAFRARMRELADRFAHDVKYGLPALLEDEDRRLRLQAFDSAADRGYGKPAQPIEGELTHRYIVEIPHAAAESEAWALEVTEDVPRLPPP